MKLNLPTFTFFHGHRKERTVSIANTQWTWFVILFLGAFVFTLGGVHAMYSFMHIDVVSAVPTELRAPVRWQAERAEKVLTEYGSREQYFIAERGALGVRTPVLPPPVAATTTELSNQAQVESEVATTSPPAVE